jgi:hypothetical protein
MLREVMLTHDLLSLLKTFALKNKSAVVDVRQFIDSIPSDRAEPSEVEAGLLELGRKSALTVSLEEGKPRTITIADFALLALVDEYHRLATDATRPFPKENTLGASVPAEQLIAADVKAQLGALLESSAPGMKGIVRLQFPENVDTLVVPQELVGTELIEAAVAKISRYVSQGKNGSYAEVKLAGLLRGNEVLVRQSMEDVATRPKKAAATVMAPSEFTFRFWTHLSNLIVQDLRAKGDKSEQEQGVLQSAYIIGYAVFHKKGAVQREQEWTTDRRNLEQQVRKAPFVFGFQDLYNLKDEKGSTYISKHTNEFIHDFLRDKTKPSKEEPVPYLVRAHAVAQKKDYFIQRDFLVPVFLKKLTETSEQLRKEYLDEWAAEIKQDRVPAVAKNDATFRRDVETRVKQGVPLLAALSNGALLFAAADAARIPDAARTELRKCFAVENILRPYDELLGLSRPTLLKDVRMYLPFWMTVPVLSGVLRVLRRMFKGGKAVEEPAPQSASIIARPAHAEAPQSAAPGPAVLASGAVRLPNARESLVKYRQSVQSLVAQYVPRGATIDATLAELAEKWNPLYAAEQKRNLVEDVNALVRDFLRPVRRTFLVRPPDIKRIHALAEQLSTSKSLAKIKKRDLLMRYLELYMIRCLQVKQL